MAGRGQDSKKVLDLRNQLQAAQQALADMQQQQSDTASQIAEGMYICIYNAFTDIVICEQTLYIRHVYLMYINMCQQHQGYLVRFYTCVYLCTRSHPAPDTCTTMHVL